jgi:hypothetical protein
MGPLPALVALLATATPERPCFLPSDQTAGWKRVALPETAPALAAPEDVDQFRTGEPALAFEEDPGAYVGASEEHLGRMAYTFRVPRDARRLELGVLEPLRGAKVDVVAYAGSRAFPLLDEKRHAGTEVAAVWSMDGVDRVVVRIHRHFREKPVVRTWRVGRQVGPGTQGLVPEGFRTPRSLYFRHPGGRRLELCEAPNRPLAFSLGRLGEAPHEVTLTRTR